jgi:glutamyl-tRNA reductase
MVIGENQITGQVKDAYSIAKKYNTIGPVLHSLFSYTFYVVKKVKTETAISKGTVSISSVAVKLAKEILGMLDNKTVMIIGAGKTSRLTLKHLLTRGCATVLVANRTYDHARCLAEEFSGKAIKFDKYLEEMINVDIVISSTSAPHYIIKPHQVIEVMSKRDNKPLVFIDLAVPRDIPPEVGNIPYVYLYTIDCLNKIAEENIAKRRAELVKAEQIVEECLVQWIVNNTKLRKSA